MIMEQLKKLCNLDFILKVGLFINDLKQYKDLNQEYIKFWGQKPPVRVCVEVPGDEMTAFFISWNPALGDFEKMK